MEKLISAFIFLVGATILSVVCIIFEKCHKRIDSNKYDNQSADSNEEKIEEISSNQQEAQCNIEIQNHQNDVKLWKHIRNFQFFLVIIILSVKYIILYIQ